MNDKGADEDIDDADGDNQHGKIVHVKTIVEGVEDMGAGCERNVSFAENKIYKNHQHDYMGLGLVAI